MSRRRYDDYLKDAMVGEKICGSGLKA